MIRTSWWRALAAGLTLLLPAGLRAQAGGFLPPGPQTLALWHLDEGSGPLAGALGRHPIPATLSPGAVWTSSPWGGAVRLAGGSQLIIPDPQGLLNPPGPFTLEAWVRLESLPGLSQPVVSREAATGGAAVELRFLSFPAGWACKLQDPQGLPLVVYGRADIKTGEWHHLAFTWDGQTARLWLDGQQLAEMGIPAFRPPDPSRPWRVGAGEGGTWLAGAVDELHLSAAALTPPAFHLGQTPYGFGKAGTAGHYPTIRLVGAPPATHTPGLGFLVEKGQPKQGGLLLLSLHPDLIQVPGGWILVSSMGVAPVPFPLDGGLAGLPGTARALIPMGQAGPGLLGTYLCAQAILADPGAAGGFSLTAGVALWFPY